MNESQNTLMRRAAALTRAGRLLEATRVITEGLGQLTKGPAAPAPQTLPAPARSTLLGSIGSLLRSRVVDALLPSSGPTVAPAPVITPQPSFEEAVHVHDGVTRRYKLYVPSRVASSPALVVMLHGCTQDPDDFARGTGMNERADRDGFLVLYPQQSRSDNPSACWNWFNRRDQSRDGGEPGLIADLVRDVVERHGIDTGRIFVAGLSAGGAMAAIVASEYPELFAAAGVHSGLPAGAAGNVPDALQVMRTGRRPAWSAEAASRGGRAVPTIVFHGDKDATVHPANGEAVVQSVLDRTTEETRAIPAPAADETSRSRPFTRTLHVLADGSTLVEHWALHGAGHAWAGGRAGGSYTDPEGIAATDRMLDFFEAHRR